MEPVSKRQKTGGRKIDVSKPAQCLSWRVTKRDDNKWTRELVQEWFKKNDDIVNSWLIVEEEASEVHWQGFIWTPASPKAVTERLAKFGDAKGQAHYSVALLKKGEENIYRYTCKGRKDGEPVDVVTKQGLLYTAEWIAGKHKAFWEDPTNVNYKKKKELSTKDMINNAVEKMAPKDRKPRAVAKIVLEVWKAYDRAYNVFDLEKEVIRVMTRFDDAFKDKMLDALMARDSFADYRYLSETPQPPDLTYL